MHKLFGRKWGTKKELQSQTEKKSEEVPTNPFTIHLQLFNTAINLLETLKEPLDPKLHGGKNYLEVIMQLHVTEFEKSTVKNNPPLLKAVEDFYRVTVNLQLVNTYLNRDTDPDVRFDYFKKNNKAEIEKLVQAYKPLEVFLNNIIEACAPKPAPEVQYLPASYMPFGFGR